MKVPHLEHFGRMQRQYHKSNQWSLSHSGLYIPHSYKARKPDDLSWWDVVGFILNGRRIIVWWQHPRDVYAHAIEKFAWREASYGTQDNWITDVGTANYVKVGRSRKRIVSYTGRQPSVEQMQHFDLLRDIKKQLTSEGIKYDVPISWKWQRLNWAMCVSITAPMEVRNEVELAALATLARKLIMGKTTLQAEFPEYKYGRSEWLKEQDAKI